MHPHITATLISMTLRHDSALVMEKTLNNLDLRKKKDRKCVPERIRAMNIFDAVV